MRAADLQRELLGIYATEAVELLDRIDEAVTDLEGAPSDEATSQIRRLLHSLKGGAYSAGLPTLGDLVHSLEEVFSEPAAHLGSMRAARRALDGLGEALQALPRAGAEPVERLTAIREELLLSRAGGDAEPATPEALEGVGELPEPQVETVGRVDLDVLSRLADRLLEARGYSERLTRQFNLLLSKSNAVDPSDRLRSRGRTSLLKAANLSSRLQQSLADAVQDSARLRLRPVASLLRAAKTTAEDTLRRTSKQGRVVCEGGEVLLDRRVGQRLQAVLGHLVRNAIDHGFDSPAEREAAGKSGAPTLTVRIEALGIRVALVIEDDGRGVDLQAVRQRAVKRGLIEAGDELREDQLMALLFEPGFSTRSAVSSTSGRGVGLDVVRSTVEGMNGRIRLQAKKGQGTSIRLEVPVSVATSRVLVVVRGEQRFAIPLVAADRVIDLRATQVELVGGRRTLLHDQRRIPVVDLSDVYALRSPGEPPVGVVVDVGDRSLALGVDRIEQELEVSVRPVGEPFNGASMVSGLAFLDDGAIVPAVDLAEIARRPATRGDVRAAGAMACGGAEADADGPRSEQATVLVVDDSITTRTLERDILRLAGYAVRVATNGAEALVALEAGGVDLLITDLEMPQVDGLELVRRIRGSPEHSGLPAIVVTSRSDARESALAAGANACVLKSAFDQEKLLDEVAGLLERVR